jgi:putative transposase
VLRSSKGAGAPERDLRRAPRADRGDRRDAARLPAVAAHPDAARPDVLAFTAFPKELWRQIWSNNPQERAQPRDPPPPRRRRHLPDRNSLIRLVGAVLAEQHDDLTEGRRYLGLDILARSRITLNDTTPEVEYQPALSA